MPKIIKYKPVFYLSIFSNINLAWLKPFSKFSYIPIKYVLKLTPFFILLSLY